MGKKDIKMYRPVVSICMIVKNEQKNLERCLDSLAPIIYWKDDKTLEKLCQLIIVDTGSTDLTPNIAKKHADVYKEKKFIPWNFSKARNEAVKYAEGEWIFTVDADEKLDQSCVYWLKDILTNADFDLYNTIFLNIRSYSNPENTTYNEFMQSRIFRNDGEFHYKAKIHNQPQVKTPYLFSDNVFLWHYGYKFKDNDELVQKKTERAIAPLQKQLEKNPDDLHALIHLMKTYRILKKWDKVEILARHGMKLMDKVDYHQGWYAYLEIYISLMERYLRKNQIARSLVVMRKLQRKEQNVPDAALLLGDYYLRAGNEDKAVEWFERADFMRKIQTSDYGKLMTTAIQANMPKIYNFLALYWYGKGRLRRAGQYVNEGISIDEGKSNIRWDIFNFKGALC